MKTLKQRILDCKTPDELNSLRLLIVRDKNNFAENQKAFGTAMNRLKTTPIENRPKQWGKYYNPTIKQQDK